MDFDLLFARRPLTGSPVTVLVRLPNPAGFHHAAYSAAHLLSGSQRDGEVLVVTVGPSQCRWPRWHLGYRIRWLIDPTPTSGGALSRAIACCQTPIIAFVDPQVSLTRNDFSKLVHRLAPCDLVVGKRSNVVSGWLRRPLTTLLCRSFGANVADPLSPFRMVRRSVVEGVVWQTAQPLLNLEMIAKLTYLTCLLDEVPIAAPAPEMTSVWRSLGDWSALADLALRPRFWSVNASGTTRKPSHELGPPELTPLTPRRTPYARRNGRQQTRLRAARHPIRPQRRSWS
jgi:hypothetical protein